MWSGTKNTFRRHKTRDSAGSHNTATGGGYGDLVSPNVNFAELGMPGEHGGDMSGSLGIKAPTTPTTPGGKPHQKHNSFISSHVSNLWDRASSRRRAMSSGAKSNPPPILEVGPSMDKMPDPRDAVWAAQSLAPPVPPVPGTEPDRERRLSLKRVSSRSSSRKSLSRPSNIPLAAMPQSNVPAPVSILRKSQNHPSGPPPTLSPASSVHSQRMPPPRPPHPGHMHNGSTPSGLPQPTGIQHHAYANGIASSNSMSSLPQPTGIPHHAYTNSTASASSMSRRPAPQPPHGQDGPGPSGLPHHTGIPKHSYSGSIASVNSTSNGVNGGLQQPSQPQPSGLPRSRRMRPSGMYGFPGGPPAPDVPPSNSSHSHSLTHTRGNSVSRSEDAHGGPGPRLKSVPSPDDDASKEQSQPSGRTSTTSLSASTTPAPATPIHEDALSPTSQPGKRRSIPAPSVSLKSVSSGVPVPSTTGSTASSVNGDRRSRLSSDALRNMDISLPPTQDQARYSAKPLPPAPAGATALSRLPSLRTKVPIVVSATPVTHVKDHIRTNTVTTMPTVADIELTTPTPTVRGSSYVAPPMPSAMDLFAVSQKLEHISPEKTRGYAEHYMRGSELAANNSLGLEERSPRASEDTTEGAMLAYMDDDTSMSRSSTAPLQYVPLADRGETPNRKGTFGWNTPASGRAVTPTEDNSEYAAPATAAVEPQYEPMPLRDEETHVTRPRKDTFGMLDFAGVNSDTATANAIAKDRSPPRTMTSISIPPVEYHSLVTPATPTTAGFEPPPVQYRPVMSPDPDSARPKSGNWFTTGAPDAPETSSNASVDEHSNTVDLSSSPDLDDNSSRPQSDGWFEGPAPPTRLPAVADLERLEKTPTQPKARTFSGFSFSATRIPDSPNSSLSPTAIFKRLRGSPTRPSAYDEGNTSGSTEMVAQPSSEGHAPVASFRDLSERMPARTWPGQGERETASAPVPTRTWPLQPSSPAARSRSGSPEPAELTDAEEEPRSQLRSAVTPVDWPIMSRGPSGPSIASSTAASVVDETPAVSTVSSPSAPSDRRLDSLDGGRPSSGVEEVITFGPQTRPLVQRPFASHATKRAMTPDSDDDIFMSPPMAPYLSESAPQTPSEYMTPYEGESETEEPDSSTFTGDESVATADAVTADEMSSEEGSLERALSALAQEMSPGRLTPKRTRKRVEVEDDAPASPTTPRMARALFPQLSSNRSTSPSPHSLRRSSIVPGTVLGNVPAPSPNPAAQTTPERTMPSPRKALIPPSPITNSPNRRPPPSVDVELARTDDDEDSSEMSPTESLVITPGVNDFPRGSRSRSASPNKRMDLTTPPRIPALDIPPDSPTDPIGITPRKAWSPIGVILAASPEPEPAVADVSFTLPLSTSTTAEDLAGEALGVEDVKSEDERNAKVAQDMTDAIEELEQLMKEEQRTEEEIRDQSTPVPVRAGAIAEHATEDSNGQVPAGAEINISQTPPEAGLGIGLGLKDASRERDEDISSINSSPPVRIADLNNPLDDHHFATAPITTSLDELLFAADGDASRHAVNRQDTSELTGRASVSVPIRPDDSFENHSDGQSRGRDNSLDTNQTQNRGYTPYGYPYGSQMAKSAVSLSIDEPPHSANTDSSRSSATFGLEYFRRSTDSFFDEDSPYGYQRSLANASKDSILLSSSPNGRYASCSPRSTSASVTTSPLQPSAAAALATPDWPHAQLGLGSPIGDELGGNFVSSPATQSLALAGAPVSETLLRPTATSSPVGASRDTPSPTSTESRTISAASRPFADADSPTRDTPTPVPSEPSPSRGDATIVNKRNTIVSPVSRALMTATESAAVFGAPSSHGKDHDTVKARNDTPSPQKRFSTPIRSLMTPDVPSPTTTETGTTETDTTETIRATASPVANSTLPKPVSRASSTSKPRPPPLRPTFFAPPPLNSDGTLLVVGSQHFNETLEQVSSSLGTVFKLSPDGLHIQAPAHDLFLIADHIKMMRSLLGDMHRPPTRTLHESRSPVPLPPPPPPPPPPLSAGVVGSPALSPKLLPSPSLGPDSPPSTRTSTASDSVAHAAATAALKRASSSKRISSSTPPKSPVLQSLAGAATAKALKHGAFTSSPPTSPTASANSVDPWRDTREKMRHVATSPHQAVVTLPSSSDNAIPVPASPRRADGVVGTGTNTNVADEETPQTRRRRKSELMKRVEREEGLLFRKANKHDKVPPLPTAPRGLKTPQARGIARELSPLSPSSSGAPSTIASGAPSPILSSPPAEVRPQIDAVYDRLKQSSLANPSRYPRTASLSRERTRGSRTSPASSISSRIEMSALPQSSPVSAVAPTSARMNRLERRGSTSSSGHSGSVSSFRVQRKPIPREASDSSRDTRDTSVSANTLHSSMSSYTTKDTSTANTSMTSSTKDTSMSMSRDAVVSDSKPSPKANKAIPAPSGPPNSFRSTGMTSKGTLNGTPNGTAGGTPNGTPTALVFPTPKVRATPSPAGAPTRLPHISAIAPTPVAAAVTGMAHPMPAPAVPQSNLPMRVPMGVNVNAYETPRGLGDDMKNMSPMSPITAESLAGGQKSLARIKPPKSYRFKFGRSGSSVD